MKASTTASILGLLSAPALGMVSMPAAAVQESFRVEEGGVKFKVSRYIDGRSTPYRVYFWDRHLSGSTYRFGPVGHVEYFSAGSEVYYDRMEMDDESVTYSARTKIRDDESTTGSAHVPEEAMLTAGCNECLMAWDAVCGVGLPVFCSKVRRHYLGEDGAASVEILCDRQDGACDTTKRLCDHICDAENQSESTRSNVHMKYLHR